jgi:hypothetical protein
MPRFISPFGRRPLKHAALFVMVPSLFLGAPAALAAVVIIRVTGVVTSGVDQTGIFGRANTNLAGKDYTQVFIVDDTKGTKTVPLGTPPYASHIAATPTSNPMTATITIGNGTVYYGVRPTNAPPNSLVTRQSNQMVISTGGESYWVGTAVGEGSMEAGISFAYPPYTANYNWESALDYRVATNNTSNGSFVIAYGSSILAKWLQSADGQLKVTNITETGPITAPATPHIFFFNPANNQTSDVTNTTVPVVAGEKIQLFAIPTATPEPPKAWNPQGTIVGGFNQDFTCANPLPPPNPPCGGPTQADLTNASTSFFWVTPSSGVETVTYSYTLANGQKGSVQTKFDVTPPPTPVATAKPNPKGENYWYEDTKHLFMAADIQFSATPNPPSGTYEWIQIGQIAHSTVTSLNGGKSQTCVYSSTPGIDMGNGHYPTFTGPPPPPVDDTPGVDLEPGYLSASQTFAAQMYLLWKSNLPQSIPVPLGYVLWGFSESANFNPTLGVFPTYPNKNLGGWSTMPKLIWQTGSENFIKSGQFPTWNSQFKDLPPDCK